MDWIGSGVVPGWADWAIARGVTREEKAALRNSVPDDIEKIAN